MTVGPLTALASSRCSSRRSPGGPCIEMRTRHPAARAREHQAQPRAATPEPQPHIQLAVPRGRWLGIADYLTLRWLFAGCASGCVDAGTPSGYAGLAARRGRARCGLLLGCAQPGLVLLWPENRL